jgi:DNA-binding transcriptional LysR family regulator
MADSLPDDLDLLLALDVLLRERHVTRTARRLGITQSAASQRLGRLRAFFGDPLLVAGRPLLVLTPRAQAIAGPLAAALAALRAALAAGAPFDPASSERRFVLLGNDLLEALAMPPLMSVLSAEAPGLTISVERADEGFVDRLERGTADLAFMPAGMLPRSLRGLALPPERFVVLMRKGHPLAGKRLSLERYLSLSHLLIAPRGMPGSIVDRALDALGRSRRVVARVQHFVAAPFVIAGSDLVVTCPESVARAAGKQLGLRAAAPPLELPIDRSFMVWHERAQDDAGHSWLRGKIGAFVRGPSGRK